MSLVTTTCRRCGGAFKINESMLKKLNELKCRPRCSCCEARAKEHSAEVMRAYLSFTPPNKYDHMFSITR